MFSPFRHALGAPDPKFPAQSPESTFRVYVGLFSRPTSSVAKHTTPEGPSGPKSSLLWGADGWSLGGHPQECMTTLAGMCVDMPAMWDGARWKGKWGAGLGTTLLKPSLSTL